MTFEVLCCGLIGLSLQLFFNHRLFVVCGSSSWIF